MSRGWKTLSRAVRRFNMSLEGMKILSRVSSFVKIGNGIFFVVPRFFFPSDRATRAGDLIDDLYLLAICNRKDIKSIRDLNSTHLPLLRNMKKKILLWITEKYKVPESKLLLYVHYPPSHYHFHVHVSHLENSRGKLLGKSILFHELVENLELFDNYYLVRSLQFSLSSSHPLAVDLLEGGSYVPDR
eukprot:TRINITY_DN1070_c0_g1_i1.p1 TRINITY_DN1070_c0_g1~~TRINITY_DN1070_c0_g1_i1.p1  ORF type:complete len:187 (+),score=30.42 TRINITY_DN1070_c0_g1_i1:560-1120(+)